MTQKFDNLIEIPELRNLNRIFQNREHAGTVLADMMTHYKDTKSIVFGIPAGGVPVAASMASKLNLNLDVAVVSKITLPWNTETGYGAVAYDGTVELNIKVLSQIGLTDDQIKNGIKKTKIKVERRFKEFRGIKPFPDTRKYNIILVDDGVASGFTMLVAVEALKKTGASKIIVATPTAHLQSLELIVPEVDKIYCANIRSGWGFAVANAYQNWYDVSEGDVIEIMSKYFDIK
jgi:predicted phosphoribosyltransferase